MSLPPLTRQVFFRILGLVTTIVSFVSIVVGLFGDNAAFGIGGLFLGAAIVIFSLSLKTDKKTTNTITAEQAAAHLNNLLSYDRVKGISNLYPALTNQLSGEEVSIILGWNLISSDRVAAIKILNPKIRKPLSEKECELVLDPLLSRNRTEALAILSSSE